MPTALSIEVCCAYCKAKTKTTFFLPAHFFGETDLDYRYSFNKGISFESFIDECEGCGYVSDNIKQKRKNGAKTMRTQRYIDCDGIKTESKLVKKYLRNAILDEASGVDAVRLMEAYLKVAWACDDEDEKELAIKMRKKVALILENNVDCFKMDRYKLIRADVYRRSGQFDKVIEQFSDCEAESSFIKKYLGLEVEKAKVGDMDRYMFDRCDILSTL